jgi:hypothetical protein
MGKNFRRLLRVALAASLITGVAFAVLLTLTPTPAAIASLGSDGNMVSSSRVEPAPLAPMLEIQARRVISPDMDANPNLSNDDRLAGVTGLEIQARRVISPTD